MQEETWQAPSVWVPRSRPAATSAEEKSSLTRSVETGTSATSRSILQRRRYLGLKASLIDRRVRRLSPDLLTHRGLVS